MGGMIDNRYSIYELMILFTIESYQCGGAGMSITRQQEKQDIFLGHHIFCGVIAIYKSAGIHGEIRELNGK